MTLLLVALALLFGGVSDHHDHHSQEVVDVTGGAAGVAPYGSTTSIYLVERGSPRIFPSLVGDGDFP
jgi:hypothetical protein